MEMAKFVYAAVKSPGLRGASLNTYYLKCSY